MSGSSEAFALLIVAVTGLFFRTFASAALRRVLAELHFGHKLHFLELSRDKLLDGLHLLSVVVEDAEHVFLVAHHTLLDLRVQFRGSFALEVL